MRYGEPNRIQWELLFCALGAGFLLGLCFAALTPLRAKLRRPAAKAAADVLFCVFSAFLTFAFLLDYGGGTVRSYLLAAQFAGFFAVRAAARKIIVKLRKKRLQESSRVVYNDKRS